jgi:predicted component of type VI protein secretion system
MAAAPAPVAGGSPPAPPEAHAEKLRLKVTAGNATGTKIEVSDELVIGRHAEGVGRLADDVEISRRHARLARAGSGFVVEDLGSTNGTFLNGRRIEAPELLSVGDEIELGGTRMIVQVSAATPPSTPAPAHDTPPSTPSPAPTEETAPPTEAAPPVEPPPRVPRVALRIELDLEAGEAHVALDDSSDSVRLVFEDGSWRIVPPE